MTLTTADRLNDITLGEAMFTQRAIRRFKRDPLPEQVVSDIMQSAIRAPNGGNNQQWHFIVVRDAAKRAELAGLYREAWWAKRRDAGIMGPEDIPPGKSSMRSAMRMADEFGDAPLVVLLCATAQGAQAAGSVIPSAQNMLLAARAFGVGGTIATLHACVDERVRGLFHIPDTAQVVYCMPFGYPRGAFGPVSRNPLAEVCGADSWDNPYAG